MQTLATKINQQSEPTMAHQAGFKNPRPFRQVVRNCPEHGDYDLFRLVDGVSYGTDGCIPCYKQRQIRHLTKMDLIPPKFIQANFKNYLPENDQAKNILASAIDYAETFEERKRHSSCMLFSGRIGTGKTHLACAVGNSIIASGFTALYVTTMGLVSAVRSAWDDPTLTEAKVIQSFATPDLLILDEVGRNRGTDDEKKILFDVMDKRYLMGLPCLAITNKDIDGVKQYLGSAVFDRLREGGGSYHEFNWQSHRGKK